MISHSTPQQPLGPLTIGNIVTIAVNMYLSHPQLYLNVSLLANLWLAPFSVGIIVLSSLGDFIVLPLLPIWLIISIYGLVKYLSYSALIYRITFNQLVNNSESMQEAKRYIFKQKIKLLLIKLQIILSIYINIIGMFMMTFILLGLAVGVFPPLAVLLGIVLIPTFIIILIKYISLWLLCDVPLALGETLKREESIQRSGNLAKQYVFNVQGVVIVTFLVCLPIETLTNYIPQSALATLNESDFNLFLNLLFYLLSLAGTIVILPLWQIAKTLLYYDLRCRKEGLDLELAIGEVGT